LLDEAVLIVDVTGANAAYIELSGPERAARRQGGNMHSGKLACRWVRGLVALVIAAVAVCTPACQPGLDRRLAAECAVLVSHVVDLEFADNGISDPARVAVLAKHRATMKAALRDRMVADCLTWPRAHLKCAMAARTPAEFKGCR
jgi:hypothetical protein